MKLEGNPNLGFELSRQKDYWQRTLGDELPVLHLCADHPRPPVCSFIRASESIDLASELCGEIRNLCARQNVAAFVTLLAAFKTLLFRHSGSDDIIVGSVSSDSISQTEQRQDRFTNPIALRTSLQGDPSFARLLKRVARTVEAASVNRDYPFERIVEDIHEESHFVFQVMFVVANAFSSVSAAPVTEENLASVGEYVARCELVFLISEQKEVFTVTCEYDAELFNSATIKRLLGHYQTLLVGIVANSDHGISGLPILTDPEKHQLLLEWNDTGRDYPSDKCVHELFEEQVERTPNAVAVVFENQQLTYRELNQRANQLAHHLKKLGVGPETTVGLYMERSWEMVVGLLAVLKAGGAYVPLDPEYPRDRLAFMLEDTKASVILTQRGLLEELPKFKGALVCTDGDWDEISQKHHNNLENQATLSNLAYIIYTSGSTGKPKGVQIQHLSVVNFLNAMQREPGLTDRDSLLAVTTLSFDIAGLELYLPLMVGARVVIARREVAVDGVRLAEQLSACGATIMQATPATWRMLLEAGWQGAHDLKILCGGEALPHGLASQLVTKSSSLWNMYGPTETTIWSAAHYISPQIGSISVGLPVDNTQIYILDDHLQPVPVGVLGEIHIGGDGLTRGYRNRPELTAEKFIPNPFSSEPGARLYKTGDLARYLSDGKIELLGRMDHQVKIRGHRIELGEIESVLNQHSALRESVVLAREDVLGDKRLAAYIVSNQQSTPSINDLRSFLTQKLPVYMVPSAFVFLDSLPLTPNGKMDRGSLPPPDQSRAGLPERYMVPRSSVEEILVGIWAEVLKLARVGVHDNFFDLGGHSLLATQVMSRLREAFHIELPLRAMFEAPTAAGLAERVEAARGKQDLLLHPIVPVPRETDLSLSSAQQRLWFLDQLEPDSAVYNVPTGMRFKGLLNVGALEQSINEIVRRQEALRTSFSMVEGQPIQVISSSFILTLPLLDLRNLFEAEREVKAQRVAVEEGQRPFDLSRGPLLRSKLVRMGDDDHVLLVTMHHIVSDGWSMGVFFRELSILYEAFSKGKPVPLAELPIQYVDYAVWQRDWIEGEILDTQLSYWKKQLENIPTLQLPTDRRRPTVQSYRGAGQSLELSKALSDQVKALSRKEGTTLFMTLLAAFQTLLCRYTGQEDIAVGSPIAGRTRTEIEGLIGFFVNTLVLRCDLSGNPTFRELLARVREVAFEAYAHQDVPFEKLVEELKPERNLSHSPLFQVMFDFQNAPSTALEFEGLCMSPIRIESETAKFDLTLSIREENGGLRASVQYNTDLFDSDTITRMLGHFQNLLQGILHNPDDRIDMLSLITQDERQQAVAVWSRASQTYSQDAAFRHLKENRTRVPRPIAVAFGKQPFTLAHAIANWARLTPNAVALEAHGRMPLTYGRLHTHIDALVGQLRKFGIKRNDRVALVLGDGPEMAVAFLAVATGASSAPLNPAYRAGEFEFYFEDLKPKALIAQAGTDSPARAIAHARGIPILELSPKLDGEAGIFNFTGETSLRSGLEEYPHPSDVALVLHTSGTTSRPKLVPLTHANLLTSALNIQATLALGQDDRCLNIMPMFHIHGLVGALLSSLAAGASVVCTGGFYAPEFFGWLEEFRPTWYTAVPTMHQAILGRPQTNHDIISRCPLRFIRSCSAALPSQVMKELEKIFQVPVIESYGMTEAAHQIASNPLPPGQRKEGSVGVAAGLEVAIIDRMGNILASGAGEVVIRGANVTLGYGNDTAGNASTFTRGWFHTGDQGYLDTDGYLFLTGRIKEIINRGGEKISPREVDEILMAHPAVAQAVTFGVPDSRLGEEVAAAVVLREQTPVTGRQLREFTAIRLADFKVPGQILILDEIPKGPTGKVQRIGLAEKLGLIPLHETTTREPTVFEEPQTATEILLADIWIELLGLQQVGRQDNFFHLGGDSLTASRVIARVCTILQAEISLTAFFDDPTVAGLAETVEKAKQGQQAPLSLPLSPVPRTTAIPLSSTQQALWFLEQLEPKCFVYNRPRGIRVTGAIDIPAMERSLNEIMRRHEGLRVSFPMTGGVPIQVVAPTQQTSLPVVDLSTISQPRREVEARERARDEAQRLFDLTEGPVLRAALLKLSEEDHVLIITMHHIASDGWSSTVFFRELATFYNAIKGGVSPGLPPLRIQYVDFAEWQRQYLQGEYLMKLLSYWKERIGKPWPRLKFPGKESQPAETTPRQGAHRALHLSGTLRQALKTFSIRENVSLFMALLAAFKTLLHRYTGQDDVLVAAPIAGRKSEELEGVIGNFANILALRTDLSGNPSFRTLLNRVREVTLQAYAHQDLPLGKLAEALGTQRGIDIGLPLQVMLNLRNLPPENFEFAGLKTAEFEFENGIARFDLSIDVFEKADELVCLFEYDTALFDSATISRLMRHFQVLLEGILENPDETINNLPLLSSTEQRHAVDGWNFTPADLQWQRGIHHLFEEQATRTPNATAVAYDGNGLSYVGLNRRANQLAHHLRGLGVGPDALVGICVERSIEMVVGLLGILKAGGAYVPLDPQYPKERLAFLLEDTEVSVILTQQRLISALPPNKARVVLLDGDWPTIARGNDANPGSNITADHLAYVIYTSGSTGKPKGVLITHRGVVNHSLAVSRHFALHAHDRIAQCASLNFDISVEEIFPSWISGAAVILCPSSVFFPGTDLARWTTQEEITVLNLPTAFWHEWVNELERSQETLSFPLRLVVVGGEKVSAQAFTKWKHIAGTTVRWVNTYGPTEGTVTTTFYEPPSDVEAREILTEIPIGRPISNSQVYVLDRYLQPVPLGVPGELYIWGYGVARGYLNQPELTAEKFIAHPFSTNPGARLYKTGDVVRYRPDDNLEFIGRTDHQVKIRGFRIELGEIESALSQHPSVREGVVLAREDVLGDKRLVAYIVSNQQPGLSTDNLRSFLKQKLPEYMRPTAFVFLDSLPLTPNGKVDHRALPAPDQARPELVVTFVAPRTPVEELLAGIWVAVLKVENVGVHDNFFELGGHSLLATQVISRVHDTFGLNLPVRTLFENPTIDGFANMIQTGKAGSSNNPVTAITPLSRQLYSVKQSPHED